MLRDRFYVKRSEEEHRCHHFKKEFADLELDFAADERKEAGIAINLLGVRRPSPQAPAPGGWALDVSIGLIKGRLRKTWESLARSPACRLGGATRRTSP